ncbi:phosphotransferase enzyme family protein [Cellulomonas endophytica]|uniref:phosphotransferase enzyme family protein n=1 Tax=Cellulomonas endophytica TaxID=2494735 RepID=UPI0010116695|nr:phosphotransferase [Cellulomonas endophytica]
MLPLTEIDRLARTVDATWRSPVGDAAAGAWGLEPGTARWWRSSASHVFVVPPVPGRPRLYLRLHPAAHRTAAQVRAVAVLQERLVARGVRVAPFLRSRCGRLVETVATPVGPLHATAVAAAPGEAVALEDLGPDRALAWGAHVATLHEHLAACADGLPGGALPDAAAARARAAAALVDDPSAAAAARRVAARVAGLERAPGGLGVLHGDPELDNLAWDDGRPTAFDLDEAERGPLLADVAHAVRDLLHRGRPRPEHAATLDAFLEGYLRVRPRARPDLVHLPLLARAGAARSLADVRRVLAAAEDLDPAVLPGLRTHLVALAGRHRAELLHEGQPEPDHEPDDEVGPEVRPEAGLPGEERTVDGT